jgi:hypothetical protein
MTTAPDEQREQMMTAADEEEALTMVSTSSLQFMANGCIEVAK